MTCEFAMGSRLNETKETAAGTKTPDDIADTESTRVKYASIGRKPQWHEAS
jgi:hypothetical protein